MSVLVLDPVPTNPTLLDVARRSDLPPGVMSSIINALANPPVTVMVESEIVDQFGRPILVERPYGITWKEWICGNK